MADLTVLRETGISLYGNESRKTRAVDPPTNMAATVRGNPHHAAKAAYTVDSSWPAPPFDSGIEAEYVRSSSGRTVLYTRVGRHRQDWGFGIDERGAPLAAVLRTVDEHGESCDEWLRYDPEQSLDIAARFGITDEHKAEIGWPSASPADSEADSTSPELLRVERAISQDFERERNGSRARQLCRVTGETAAQAEEGRQ